MPAKRELTMRQLRQMLWLHHDGVSTHEIGHMLSVARSTIRDNLSHTAKAGLIWPLASDLTDDILEQRLFSKAGSIPGRGRRAESSRDLWFSFCASRRYRSGFSFGF